MRKNLSEMPNNKGYIWRGCYMYGDLPEQKNQPVIIFDKCKNNIMKIIDTTEYDQHIYEKHGKEKKYLLSRSIRKKKNIGSISITNK